MENRERELLNGSLNMYFPCKIKSDKNIKRFLVDWERQRESQKHLIKVADRPLSDLSDSVVFRNENEDNLGLYLFENLGWFSRNMGPVPYALPCLKWAYRRYAGDSINTKVVNFVISRFDIRFNVKDKKYKDHKEYKLPGLLLCNINLDSSVVTYTISLNFKDIPIDDVIFLKHLFYKRGIVKISEKKIRQISKNSISSQNKECAPACPYSCIECENGCTNYEMSFQEYVVQKNVYKNSEIELDLDSAARFSLLENDKTNIDDSEIWGLLTADEGYRYRRIDNLLRSISGNCTYSYYLEGTHGLISVNRKCYEKYVEEHNHFLDGMELATNHKVMEQRMCRACVAGVDVCQFPSFMKAVELHYLIRCVLSNDIAPRKQSYFNPLIFVRRGYRLWKIIYELDVNQHHQYSDLLNSFGVDRWVKEIRTEYRDILTHSISYFALFISIISLIVSFFIK